MMTDPIADMLTRIRNAVRIEAPSVDVPYSKIKQEIARVLQEEGFLTQFEVHGEGAQKVLRVQLKYGPNGEHVIQVIDRVSKPGRRIYKASEDLKPVLNGMGISILKHQHRCHERSPSSR